MFSPGPLARAHTALEGVANCQRCHEAGRRVSAQRCLSCHKPIAERIAARKGVHRDVKDQCTSCHLDHAGPNADIRRLDTAHFEHDRDTGYPLTGGHAVVATRCASCHTTRTFLAAKTACSSCHADAHKGTLGVDCTRCHSAAVPFKESSQTFDHRDTRFALTGAHQRVTCVKCHASQVFRGLQFGSCTSCHHDPHDTPLGSCSSCHTTDAWRTRSVDHAKTRFPLLGAHSRVACERCHVSKPFTAPVGFAQCASCHTNVHRQSIKDDCATCHGQATFRGAPFDHFARTRFPLEGRHGPLTCRQCHTTITPENTPLAAVRADFSGARSECVTCHAKSDRHDGRFGRACDSCHRPATFVVKGFEHPRAPEFFAGQHATAACERCHVPSLALEPDQAAHAQAPLATVSAARTNDSERATAPPMACASCHADVHLGQLGSGCETCHAVTGAKFVAQNFAHQRTHFPLTGRHNSIKCADCHRSERRAYPTRTGTATHFRPLDARCASCHADPHLGQVAATCETCHSTSTFTMTTYKHTGMQDFFGGFHGRYACRDCHKPETGQFPSGRGTAVRLLVGRTCMACHPQF